MAVRDIALPPSYALGLDSLSALRRRLDNDPARRVRAHAHWQLPASLAQSLRKALPGGLDDQVAAYRPAGLAVA